MKTEILKWNSKTSARERTPHLGYPPVRVVGYDSQNKGIDFLYPTPPTLTNQQTPSVGGSRTDWVG